MHVPGWCWDGIPEHQQPSIHTCGRIINSQPPETYHNTVEVTFGVRYLTKKSLTKHQYLQTLTENGLVFLSLHSSFSMWMQSFWDGSIQVLGWYYKPLPVCLIGVLMKAFGQSFPWPPHKSSHICISGAGFGEATIQIRISWVLTAENT